MKNKFMLTATLFLVLTASFNIHAVQGALSANVLRTLVHVDLFGRCMALLDQPVNSATNGPNCLGGSLLVAAATLRRLRLPTVC